MPDALGVLAQDRATGALLPGVPLVAFAEYAPAVQQAGELHYSAVPPEWDLLASFDPAAAAHDTSGRRRVPLGLVASDHAGYASFSLRALGLPPAKTIAELMRAVGLEV